MIGVPPDVCRTAWNKLASRGWVDARNIPVVNFASYLKVESTYDRERLSRTPATQLPERDQRKKAMIAEIDRELAKIERM